MMSTTTLNGTGSVRSGDDEGMDSSHPRAGGPSRRRSFTPAQKVEHLAEYEAACQTQQGGVYLRREGLYSSHVIEWRKLRDAGVLAGKDPGRRVGRPTKDQFEVARLRRELEATERRLASTESALVIMGKVFVSSIAEARSGLKMGVRSPVDVVRLWSREAVEKWDAGSCSLGPSVSPSSTRTSFRSFPVAAPTGGRAVQFSPIGGGGADVGRDPGT